MTKNTTALPSQLLRRSVLGGMVLTAVAPAWAQFQVEVTGVGGTQIPVSVVDFRGEDASPQKVASIVRADLERSGLLRIVSAQGVSMDENTRPDLNLWRQRGASAVAGGSVMRLADGRYDVRFRLWNVAQGQEMGGQSYVVPQADLRLTAHKIADYIYEKLLGERGVFSSRMAYVTKAGRRHTLWVADADGEGAQAALTSGEPIISPTWSPDGRQLAYVSFESRKPVVYVHDVATGRRRLLANFRGSNSAPAWSPDGRSIALTLSRDGGSQLYVMSVNGGEPRRLMKSSGIDTEPTYSADGGSIYFVSDRGGSPQIYRVSASGGTPQRVTFSGGYNISPSVSPDGKWLTYISRAGGGYKLQVMELASGAVIPLTDTTSDESPSFAPNSKMIVYTTRQGGQDALMTTTIDGKIKARLAGKGGDIREPAWAPFPR